MSATTRHFGANWWKFDFHTHTPKSDDYGKGNDQAALKSRTPREWLLDFMRAGLDCVAITDHNSGEWIDDLKSEVARMDSEKSAEFRPITLFPGVELSVNGGIHVIAVFDPNACGSTIVGLLSKCGFPGQYGRTDDCTTKSCSEVIDLICQEGGIPILAHADAPSGLFQEQSGPTLRQTLQSDGLLAMELMDPAYIPPATYSGLKLGLASVMGSDTHHPATVGRRHAWVKMESPSLEALRLALHDGEDGVRSLQDPPADPNEVGRRFHLRRLTVTEGQKIGNGRDLTLNLSPWLTTLIGGRGSGKSTILDLLRIVLAKTDGMPPEVKAEFDKFNRIPVGRGETGMLRQETSIRLELVKDGRDIALVWKSDGSCTQEEQDASGTWATTEDVGDVQKRFPVRIFSQKQLYEMTKQPDVLLNLIDERWDKRAWLEKRQSSTEKWLQNRRDLRQVEKEIAAVAHARADLEDVRAKIDIFEDSAHKQLLRDYRSAQTTKQGLEAKRVALETAAATFAETRRQFPHIELENDLKVALGDSSSAPLQAVLSAYELLHLKLASVEAELVSLSSQWTSTYEGVPWKARFDETLRAYGELRTLVQQAAGDADIVGYSGLLGQRAELEAKVKKLAQHECDLARLREEGTSLLHEIEVQERFLRTERKRAIDTWMQANTGEHIRVTLQEMGNGEAAEKELRQLIRKSGDEFANDIFRSYDGGTTSGHLAEIVAQPRVEDRWERLACFQTILREATYADPKGLDRRFARHLEQLRLNTPEDLDRVAVWTPDDRLHLDLVRADGSVEDIETGSAGQRTAGLLGLVLSLDDSPLIIDQPEDALDTRLISSLVVSGLRRLKRKQQVIVVTHNPNIPVNGAAEQIIEMRFWGGQIWAGAMGALQRQEVRRAVCEVMEGGKDALDKRYYRISRALS
jgi:ABC-type lipoprotein export system ATPase subunit